MNKPTITSLKRAGNPLALPQVQLATLEDPQLIPSGAFGKSLAAHAIPPLRSLGVQILKVNVGRVCNQTCAHCHVDAGPDRRENMTRETAEAVVQLLDHESIRVLDITGGAPEMNENFRWLVEHARAKGKTVIDRCNLTILLAPGFTDLPQFLADNQVQIVASLPCYLEENCDAQRGDGVFRKSIEALRRLNALGYGQANSDLQLSLVYNPVGTSLPPEQSHLEAEYRQQLASRFGISFSNLFTITNMPISRYLDDLLRSGKYETYMQKLIDAFNPAAVQNVMCRSMLSVDWQGYLYDCDFNQMLDLPVSTSQKHIRDLVWESLEGRLITLGNHCFGCTAGAGSSCQGAIA